jgi:hypothetical protein
MKQKRKDKLERERSKRKEVLHEAKKKRKDKLERERNKHKEEGDSIEESELNFSQLEGVCYCY